MIKTLAGQVKEFKKDSIITPIFMILEVIMEMIIPLLMSSIIDDGVEKGDVHHIYIIGIWMVVAAGIGLFAGIMGGKYGARAVSYTHLRGLTFLQNICENVSIPVYALSLIHI